jgi:hypothetical protein
MSSKTWLSGDMKASLDDIQVAHQASQARVLPRLAMILAYSF